jgi:hypothetical protein
MNGLRQEVECVNANPQRRMLKNEFLDPIRLCSERTHYADASAIFLGTHKPFEFCNDSLGLGLIQRASGVWSNNTSFDVDPSNSRLIV